MTAFENKGASSAEAINWYFTGNYAGTSTLQNPTENVGGYWKDYVNPTQFESLVSTHIGMTNYPELEKVLNFSFSNKCAMTLSLKNGDYGHTITIWGAEWGNDSDNNIDRYLALYVTDPAYGDNCLMRREITYDKLPGGSLIPIITTTLAETTLDYIITLNNGDHLFPTIPEPSVFSFFIGLSTLFLISTKRKRN